MRNRTRASVVAAAAAFLLTAAVGNAAAGGGQPVSLVSPGDPYAACDISGDGSGTNYASAEDEPYVAVSPRDARDAVGIFQQDRWSNGGARGLTATSTQDGRHFTETPLPFTHCAPGGLDYQRASDGWVSTGPDGTVYGSGLVFDATDARNGVAASTSYDGGRTWTHTSPLIDDTQAQFTDDKNSVTADPVRPGVAYQVWDRIDEDDSAQVYDGPAYISVTRDGGRHWSKARPFVDTSVVRHSQTIGNVIVVDPRTDTLYDVFDWQTYDIDYTTGTFTPTDLHFAVVKSTDQGRTWSKPVTLAKDTAVAEVDPNAPGDTSKALRAGGDLPNVAIDPHTGELYVAYEGSDFSGGAYNSVELTHSTDGGRTWSGPKRVNQVASAPAFTPSITVDGHGTVAISYYDLRYLTAGNTTTLPTAAWLPTFPCGGEDHPSEHRISRVFDWLQAPYAGWGHFLGDYEGLA
ncbi:sialidase family protein, partial [Streptomyces sp. NPDC051172]|uniref:sialidase family protein n=1 Tax=Streptomyces sp. NPDC051172 TaxID=3155796 RepID=UPI0034325948